MKNDEFGDRMKAYESVFTNQTVNTDSVLCVRIDGKRFSKFTKGFAKPFDTSLPNRLKYGSYAKPISYELSAENGPIVRSKVEEMGLGYYGDLSLEERINFIEK